MSRHAHPQPGPWPTFLRPAQLMSTPQYTHTKPLPVQAKARTGYKQLSSSPGQHMVSSSDRQPSPCPDKAMVSISKCRPSRCRHQTIYSPELGQPMSRTAYGAHPFPDKPTSNRAHIQPIPSPAQYLATPAQTQTSPSQSSSPLAQQVVRPCHVPWTRAMPAHVCPSALPAQPTTSPALG
jgi:hypothetical protein